MFQITYLYLKSMSSVFALRWSVKLSMSHLYSMSNTKMLGTLRTTLATSSSRGILTRTQEPPVRYHVGRLSHYDICHNITLLYPASVWRSSWKRKGICLVWLINRSNQKTAGKETMTDLCFSKHQDAFLIARKIHQSFRLVFCHLLKRLSAWFCT